MKNQYKIPMPIYIGNKVKRLLQHHISHFIDRVADRWYCAGCHKYHFGNVTQYAISNELGLENITLCHTALAKLAISCPTFNPHVPFCQNIILSDRQFGYIYEKVDEL